MNFRYLTEYLDSLPGKLCAPGVDCKIMYKNEEVYRHSSGWFDMENNIPVKPKKKVPQDHKKSTKKTTSAKVGEK